MKRNLTVAGILLFLYAILQIACVKNTTENMNSQFANPATRAYGDKTPKIQVYVETNDVNPLNAGDYYLPDGKPMVDIVEFFASNIHKRTVGGAIQPTLYLNPELTRLLEPDPANPNTTGYHKYVKGLQDKGIKVLVTVLGDWQGIGVCNMNDTQSTQFAAILAHVVEKYGLDGIGFSDSYAEYTTPLINGSYGTIITKLRALMPSGKLISIYEWGSVGSAQINATAGALIDYVYTNFGSSSASFVQGVTNSHYGSLSVALGYCHSMPQLDSYSNSAYDAAEGGYGAIMNFNLRRSSEVDPTPLFKAYAEGAYDVLDVVRDGGDRPQDWTFISGGYTITYADTIAQ